MIFGLVLRVMVTWGPLFAALPKDQPRWPIIIAVILWFCLTELAEISRRLKLHFATQSERDREMAKYAREVKKGAK